MPLSIMFQSFNTSAVGRWVQESHVLCTFNNVLVIYHIFAVARGVLGVRVLCHFQ